MVTDFIKNKIEQLRRKWILYRAGYKDWATYLHMTDPDIHWRATQIKNFYHGYNYVYCIENRNHTAYDWDVHTDGMWVMSQWCEDNCKDKYRFDFHRAIKFPSTSNEWEINEIGGGDYIFAAFKNERDFSWFMMRWS